MTREAVKRLLIVTGLALLLLLLAISAVLPLHAAPSSQQTATESPTLTLTTTTTTLPPPPTPTDTPAPTLTHTLTTAPSPTDTSTPTPTQTPTIAPTPTGTHTPTHTPTIPPPTDTSVPALTQTPTATPIPSPIAQIRKLLGSNLLWVGLACLVPLLALGLLLILWALRRKKSIPPPPPTPAPSTPTGPYLESVNTPGGPCRFDLKPDDVTIGRAPENDLVVTQEFPAWETVSRHHARVYQQAGHWIIEDLDSMNGVYVNRRRTGRNLLRDGWRLGIGEVEFVFHAGTGEA